MPTCALSRRARTHARKSECLKINMLLRLPCLGGRAIAAASTMMSTSAQTNLSAVSVTYHRAARVLEVELADGESTRETHRFSTELLRIASPSIDTRAWPALRGGGGDDANADDAEEAAPSTTGRVAAGRKGVGVIKIDPVGNYAVRLTFDDLHSSGIYTWDYLRQLSCRRRAVARQYLGALRERGLSRRPCVAAAAREGGREREEPRTRTSNS